MNKFVVTFLLVCMLGGTVALAQTGSTRFGANYISLANSEDANYKYTGLELFGRVWFAQQPKLTISLSYSDLDSKYGDSKFATINDLTLVGEYRVYNEYKYGFSLNAGWLNQGVTYQLPGATKETDSFLTIGGKGNYVLADNLQAIGSVSYGFNDFFKTTDDPKMTVLKGKAGVEYDFDQVPGLKLSAYYLYDKYTAKYENVAPDEALYSGFNLGASYAFSF